MNPKIHRHRTRSNRHPEVEYRIDYARAGQATRTVFRQTAGGVELVLRKLFGDGRPDLDPLVYLEVRQRKVGAWKPRRSTLLDAWLARYEQGQRLGPGGWR